MTDELTSLRAELEQTRAALRAETEDRRRQVGELQQRLEAAEKQRDENWRAFEKASAERFEADQECKDLREAATGFRLVSHEVALQAIRKLRTDADGKST